MKADSDHATKHGWSVGLCALAGLAVFLPLRLLWGW